MAKTKQASPGQEYPIPGFYFKVDFLFNIKNEFLYKGPLEASFQSVEGLRGYSEGEDYKELGFNGQPLQLITNARFDNVILKRGLVHSNKLIYWFENSILLSETRHVPVLISVLNTESAAKGKPLMSWLLYEAYPASYEVSGFDSMKSQYLIETLELRYTSFQPFHR